MLLKYLRQGRDIMMDAYCLSWLYIGLLCWLLATHLISALSGWKRCKGLTCWSTAGNILETYTCPKDGVLQVESITQVDGKSEKCIQVYRRI